MKNAVLRKTSLYLHSVKNWYLFPVKINKVALKLEKKSNFSFQKKLNFGELDIFLRNTTILDAF